ncbi:tyrosine-type recombinase/integrase [Litoricolaceae bacterium]|nr:tyrosine-type recombinase/integrase [Litorivicinaceae bacterium]
MSKQKDYLIPRGNIWYARMGIPEDVRHKLGHKREYIQSLRTPDRNVALIKSKPLIAEWKNAIHIARGNASVIQKTALMMRHEAGADTRINEDTGMSDADYAAEDIADGLDGVEQEEFYDYYTGRKGTPFNHFASEFIKATYTNTKTAGDAQRSLALFTAHCPTLESVSARAVMKWIDAETRSQSSVSKTKTFLSKYWKYLQQRDYVDRDLKPFTDIELPKTLKPRQSREAYTDDEVGLILDHLQLKQDNALTAITTLAMYTGARISEIAGLRVESVITIDGITCLKIDDAKTKAGNRAVPVHPEAQELVKTLITDSTDGYLVSGVNSKGGKDRRADVLGKRYGRLVRNDCQLPPTKVFHCFRNTVATKLESAGVPENIAADIVGHDKATMTYGLYSGGTSTQQKFDAVKSIEYKK